MTRILIPPTGTTAWTPLTPSCGLGACASSALMASNQRSLSFRPLREVKPGASIARAGPTCSIGSITIKVGLNMVVPIWPWFSHEKLARHLTKSDAGRSMAVPVGIVKVAIFPVFAGSCLIDPIGRLPRPMGWFGLVSGYPPKDALYTAIWLSRPIWSVIFSQAAAMASAVSCAPPY